MVALVYPHQLYENHPTVVGADEVWVIEEPLFFTQYRFHRQKLILHRASMQEFAGRFAAMGIRVRYVESREIAKTEDACDLLVRAGHSSVRVLQPNDNWLLAKLTRACGEAGIDLEVLPDPNFLTDDGRAEQWLGNRKRFYFTEFYIQQRKALGLLLEPDATPVGKKWTFDTENRRRLPASVLVPSLPRTPARESISEAVEYVRENFPIALGDPDEPFNYPVTPEDAWVWLEAFLDDRLHDFGAFEDAISKSEATLFHSVLTPMLNIGLITPQEVVEAAMKRQAEVPLNSLEGFIRQVIGWREFVRIMYHRVGSRQRTTNALGHTNPMPRALYDGTTGLPPLDTVIRRVTKTGYCHHIERLMILGNFMTLAEVHPDAVYQWFMEFFIDAYDWVMVPNVYGMSQYADGGLMTTKPYISGSNYILKMSDFGKGDWCEIWDGLYWRFVDKHRDLFLKNPRLSLAVRSLDQMGPRFPRLLTTAENYLTELHG